MTNEEFWKKIEHYSHNDPDKIPPLLLQANKENLSVLVVADNGSLGALEIKGRVFAYCVTDRNMQTPPGWVIGETPLEGFFFQLIDSGYNGIGFINKDTSAIGVEWSDLFPKENDLLSPTFDRQKKSQLPRLSVEMYFSSTALQ